MVGHLTLLPSNSELPVFAVAGDRWRHPVAAVLALHGLAHLVGTSSAISAIRDESSLDDVGGLWSVGEGHPCDARRGVVPGRRGVLRAGRARVA